MTNGQLNRVFYLRLSETKSAPSKRSCATEDTFGGFYMWCEQMEQNKELL